MDEGSIVAAVWFVGSVVTTGVLYSVRDWYDNSDPTWELAPIFLSLLWPLVIVAAIVFSPFFIAAGIGKQIRKRIR